MSELVRLPYDSGHCAGLLLVKVQECKKWNRSSHMLNGWFFSKTNFDDYLYEVIALQGSEVG